MKIISLHSFLVINIFCFMATSTQAMEKDNCIGEIDKLMIMHKISKKGVAHLEQKINDHVSVIHWSPFFSTEEPFMIRYKDLKNDDSELSKKVFALIAQKTKFISHNPTNHENNEINPKWNPIDECTCWQAIPNSNDIDLMSTFWNKATILAFLKQLNP